MAWSEPLRKPLPLILIRGFGGIGVEDEKRIAYQGFNDGTVYPGKRGENYNVNIIAHSIGGLLVREAVQCTYPIG